VAPSIQQFYVVQLWTWLCAVESGMCSSLMVAGRLMCILSLMRASAQQTFLSIVSMLGYLGCWFSSAFVLPFSKAGHHIHDFQSHYTCSVHLCLLAMNFLWCGILNVHILDCNAKCPHFQWACHLWIDYTVTHHAYDAFSWLFDDRWFTHVCCMVKHKANWWYLMWDMLLPYFLKLICT
jgi:hypothetical protein